MRNRAAMTDQTISNGDPTPVRCPGCGDWFDPYRTAGVEIDQENKLWHTGCFTGYVDMLLRRAAQAEKEAGA